MQNIIADAGQEVNRNMIEYASNVKLAGIISGSSRKLPLYEMEVYEMEDETPEKWNAMARRSYTINSREVANMVERQHNDLLKDIRRYAEYLGQGDFPQSDYFIESTYTNSQNKQLPCYEITKMGCEMIANKMTGKKGILFTAAYVKKFNDMEGRAQAQPQQDPLTARLDRLLAVLEMQFQQASNTPLLPEPSSNPSPVTDLPQSITAEQSYMAQLREKKMLTKDEAAFYIGIHKKTLTNIMNAGGFYPLVRIGHNRGRVFINREKLDAWINEQDGSYKAVKRRYAN